MAKVTVTPDDAEPTVHEVADAMVMEWATVHVSPGVVKLDGDVLPSVQLDKVPTAPAALVVHAVARAPCDIAITNSNSNKYLEVRNKGWE